MSGLKHPYLQVETPKEMSFGGDQSWFSRKFLRNVGCGIIGATDVLMYLRGRRKISQIEYMDFAKYLWKRYLPVIPGFGMNGLTLMAGLNRYFLQNRLPYRAFWSVSVRKMLGRIDKMLGKDIPVILSVGPNFPFFMGKHQLTFYRKTNDGKYIPAVKTKAHFVTVTAREGVWLQISSWGKCYYIDIREYREYVRNYSSPLISNIICITCRKQIK